MDEKTLVIEDLPADFESLRLKLDFYFKSKRRSGGETLKISEHPDDERKALLVYLDESDVKNVLERDHQINFKDLGLVRLKVKRYNDQNLQTIKETPNVKNEHKWEPVQTTANQTAPESCKVINNEQNEQVLRSQSLLVSTTRTTDEDTITLYFEQFSEQFEIVKHGTNSWILKLANQTDLQKIRDVEKHDFGLLVEEYTDENELEKLDPHRFILTGFKDSCQIKLVTLVISSCSQKAEHTWELLNDDNILVTFKEDIDVKSFLSRCTTKKPQGLDITAYHLELTDSVLVQGDLSKIKEEVLSGHFSNQVKSGGGPIKSFIWSDKPSVIITFEDYHAAYQVVKRKHHLCGADLTVHLFYSSLQMALTGEIPTLSDLQTCISISVEADILSFIENNEHLKNDFQNQLNIVHACVLFNKTTSSSELVMEMTVDKETLAALRVGPTWEKKTLRVAQDFLAKFSVAELAVDAEVWKRVADSCFSLITPEADIFFKANNSMVAIVGLKVVCTTLQDKIKQLLKDASADLLAERNHSDDLMVYTNRMIPIRSIKKMEYIESFMNLSEIPEIKNNGVTIVTCGTENLPYLKVTATEGKIQDAVNVINQQMASILVEKQTYCKAGESKVLERNEANAKAKAKELHCNLYISTEKLGPTKSFIHKINSYITFTVAEGNIHQHTVDALICPVTSHLAFSNHTSGQLLKARGYPIPDISKMPQRGKQSLFPGDVILGDPGRHSHTKTYIYAVMPNNNEPLSFCYLQSAILNSLHKAEERNSASVAMPVIGCGTFGFSAQESCKAIRKAILQFCSDYQNVPINIKNIFVIESDVKIVEEFNTLIAQLGFTNLSTPSYLTSPTSPLKSFKRKLELDISVTVLGVPVHLKKGDITKETVDVIVNSNNRDLNLHVGVSGAIFKAAGDFVINEYTRHGPKLDEVILTSGGNLSCKHIAQMFGPVDVSDIITSIEKVLSLCEIKMATTIAIPSIGTGGGGISADKSIKAIFTALENHLSRLNSSCLKKITVVAFDQKIWEGYRYYFEGRNKKVSDSSPTQTPSIQYFTESMLAYGKIPPNQVKIHHVRVEVRKGDIINETVKAIVNTTNNKIDSKTGVSGAILRAAGPSVEAECQKLGQLQSDTVAVTSGGNLQCDFIIHVLGPHNAAEVRLRVKKVLEQCEQKGITTISFPALGTGGGGVRSAEAIGAVLHGFKDYLSQCLFTKVKLIYIVIKQDNVLQEFLQGLKKWTANNQETENNDSNNDDDDDDDDDEDINTSHSEDKNDLTKTGFNQWKLNDMAQDEENALPNFQSAGQLYSDSDAGSDLDNINLFLMNMCNISEAQLNDKETMKVIYKLIEMKGGIEAVKDEMRKPNTTIQKEISMTLQREQVKLIPMKRKLRKADIGPPFNPRPIGNSWDTNKGFDIRALRPLFDMCGISDEELKDRTTLSVISDFIKKKGGVPVFNSTVQRSVSAVKHPKRRRIAKQALSLDMDISAVSFPVSTVEVYGTSSVDLALVKKFLDDLISDECTTKEIQSSHLTNLPEADKDAIIELSQNNQVHILMLSPDKLKVSGKKDDVLDAVLNINSFIQAAKERETQEIEEKRIRETLCWEVAVGDKWVPLNSSINYHLELAFHKNEQTTTYEDDEDTYNVDFKEMKRFNSKGACCKIKRTLFVDSDTAIIQPPLTWTKMEGRDLEIIPLSPDLEEHKKVKEEFLKTSLHKDLQPFKVLQIQRIQNKGLWQRYAVLKEEVNKKYPTQTNEQFLYHGTTKEICQKINKNGFNRSFCGRNAVYYGYGTYFAKKSYYSCYDQYSNPDESELKYVYRARVVTGLPCKGREGIKEPDPLDPNDPQAGLYNCAVNDLQKPFIFVVFCDAGAYPDYLITFKAL